MAKETVCQEAERIINGQRQQDYGDTAQNWNRIAELWSAYLGTKLSALDAINLLLLMKVSRAKRGYHRDSYVDVAGYAGLAEKVHEADQRKPSVRDMQITVNNIGPGPGFDPADINLDTYFKSLAREPKAFA